MLNIDWTLTAFAFTIVGGLVVLFGALIIYGDIKARKKLKKHKK
jgi:hypothetical protein